jgi:sortase B
VLDKVRRIVFFIAIVVFCIGAFNFGSHYYQEFVASRATYNVRQEVLLPPIELTRPVVYAETEEPEVFSTLSIDFDRLFSINRDIVGWIYIPGGFVSYPLLQAGNNYRYLNLTFDNRQNALGSIFLDFRNDPNFEDQNTIIYGHDTRNDMMFGSLKRHLDQDYTDAHRYVHIIREHDVRVYEIFAVFETSATSDVYTKHFASEEDFAEYLLKMVAQSVIAPNNLPTTESIITLSTCTPTGRDIRLVVQAKLVEILSY